jgi:hypothetical protein
LPLEPHLPTALSSSQAAHWLRTNIKVFFWQATQSTPPHRSAPALTQRTAGNLLLLFVSPQEDQVGDQDLRAHRLFGSNSTLSPAPNELDPTRRFGSDLKFCRFKPLTRRFGQDSTR